ncbi:thermospermine synthase ACAULIS5 [Ricinus communis]|uniref:thermospermine synthase n=1 Tax=Ricinus communis TaxID=3988 RepID=B9RQV3_RICCO|nr:thermospermine synthase ACAULIS5 [Ricinus communis]EEF46124.1 Spermidine synthase, putative [Ricinus communis]|eukprot:XP_002516122.1 thermospermine synthase ACAULIS5 [Ricinus communis]
MGEAVEIIYTNGFSKLCTQPPTQTHNQVLVDHHSSWYEETIDDDLKWSFALNSVLHKGTSEFQEIALLDTKRFGKVLVIDGKMQSAEVDEFIYHECLIHPALLCHPKPQNVFIMGGGEGSAAREALKHNSIEKVVMCDIDQEVVDFCRRYLTVNQEAFCHKKLNLVIDDAKAELEKRNEKFDIIVGDLADPVEGGPCYQLYTKSFYEKILKPKLKDNGIFVTQAGPAGIFTHKEVFSSIYNTIKQVFKYVVAYSAHVPSFADTWGWVLASDQPISIDAEDIDRRIEERIEGELLYLNGAAFLSSTILNKTVSLSLLNETHVYTEDDARFIPGHGLAYRN